MTLADEDAYSKVFGIVADEKELKSQVSCAFGNA